MKIRRIFPFKQSAMCVFAWSVAFVPCLHFCRVWYICWWGCFNTMSMSRTIPRLLLAPCSLLLAPCSLLLAPRPRPRLGWQTTPDAIATYSRTYAQAVSGRPAKMRFDAASLRFELCYAVAPSVAEPTVIYVRYFILCCALLCFALVCFVLGCYSVLCCQWCFLV
jgi:hypothetical protein